MLQGRGILNMGPGMLVYFLKGFEGLDMNNRIIFLDIDGTLTKAGSSEPSPSALWAVRRAREKGNLVFLCTGRNYDMLKPLLRYSFDGFVGSAGAYVMCGHQVICDRSMMAGQRDCAVELLKEKGIFYTLECKENSYTDSGFQTFLQQPASKRTGRLPRHRQNTETNFHIFPISEYKGEPVYKISVVSSARETMMEVKRDLGEDYHFWIQDSDGSGMTNGELKRNDTDKGTGILEICRFLQVPLEQTVAFGDSMNDVEMIKTAGLGVCMGNGCIQLRDVADDICGIVEQDGLAVAFEKYGLV